MKMYAGPVELRCSVVGRWDRLRVVALAPPGTRAVVVASLQNHRGYAYTTSGSPHSTPGKAFEGAPGFVADPVGEATVPYPGSFYGPDYVTLHPPTIAVRVEPRDGGPSQTHFVQLPNPTPLRTLYPRKERWEKGAYFYQERIDRTGVTDTHTANVWAPARIKAAFGTG